MLEHSKHEKYFDFFKCKCPNTREFHPHLWQYDKRHNDNRCPFRQRCDYFKTLQSIDKNLPNNEKLARLSKKNSLLRLKRLHSFMKLRYDIFFWIKNFSDTGTTQYKDEVKLLYNFNTYVFRKGKKKLKKKNNVQEFTVKKLEIAITNRIKQIEEYQLKSPEYHPVSPSAQSFDRADF